MAVEAVKKFFKKYDMEDRIIELSLSSATVELAAKALNCEEARIAKTLSFQLSDRVILIVTAGDVKVDNAKFKKIFAQKAHMIKFDEVEDLVGHAPGGVCPFAIKDGVDVYLDISLKRFETVFPACGSGNSAIELSISELEKYSSCKEWIDIAKEI